LIILDRTEADFVKIMVESGSLEAFNKAKEKFSKVFSG
jgi:hypothetical protein